MTIRKRKLQNSPVHNADAGVVVERPRPNIKFAGRPTWDKGKRKILNDPAPLDRISDAGRLILLPPADWQKANRLFYHSDAATIARAFPHLYKLVKS